MLLVEHHLHPVLPLAWQNEAGLCYSQVTGKETQTLESYYDHPWSLDWWSRSGFLISLSFKLQMALPRRAAKWQRTRKVIFMLGFEDPVFRGLKNLCSILLTAEKSAVLGSRCLFLPVLLAQHSHFSLHLVSVQLPDCLYSANRLEFCSVYCRPIGALMCQAVTCLWAWANLFSSLGEPRQEYDNSVGWRSGPQTTSWFDSLYPKIPWKIAQELVFGSLWPVFRVLPWALILPKSFSTVKKQGTFHCLICHAGERLFK